MVAMLRLRMYVTVWLPCDYNQSPCYTMWKRLIPCVSICCNMFVKIPCDTIWLSPDTGHHVIPCDGIPMPYDTMWYHVIIFCVHVILACVRCQEPTYDTKLYHVDIIALPMLPMRAPCFLNLMLTLPLMWLPSDCMWCRRLPCEGGFSFWFLW
jgi:hypothetical protein